MINDLQEYRGTSRGWLRRRNRQGMRTEMAALGKIQTGLTYNNLPHLKSAAKDSNLLLGVTFHNRLNMHPLDFHTHRGVG